MFDHVVQSSAWQEFKEKYGTPTVRVGDLFYTKHKIPFTNFYFAYCPRVNPFSINFGQLEVSLKENNCVAITFDVPNVILGDAQEEEAARTVFNKHCVKSTRSEFAKSNVLMDLTLSEDDLFKNMHTKHRYNIKYAQKHGVTVKLASTQEDFDSFYTLHKETADRQKYFARSKTYYQLVWDTLHPKNMCDILIAEFDGKPLAAWMLFIYKDVLYYPYGGSSLEMKNLFASNLIGWEAIKYGKKHGCKLFDMWGAAENPSNEKDSYYGFTTFKLKFGGKHVTYIDSYAFIVNKPVYSIFTFVNDLRWKLLERGILR